MRSIFLIFTACLFLVIRDTSANPPRSALHGIPQIQGRGIEEYLLVAPVIVDDSKFGGYVQDNIVVRMLPGRFIPIAEDDKGVFYQSVAGFTRLKFYAQVGGGVYVSKIRTGRMTAYVGNASVDSKSEVRKDVRYLPANDVRLFQPKDATRPGARIPRKGKK